MASSWRGKAAAPLSKLALLSLVGAGLLLKVDHLLPFDLETAAGWAARLGLGVVLVVLLLFLAVQLHWTWRTEGARAAFVLLFTSFVIFPPLIVMEVVENVLFPPLASRDETKNAKDQKAKWGTAPIRLEPGTMCALDGIVTHRRSEQADNAFAYRVRYYLIPLDAPPATFRADHFTADEARSFAGTDGPVLLLTDPTSMGYHQNPISVYYCYTPDGDLEICIAEVTNTPWGERVRFLFKPDRDVVPKSLHVSPFIDMHRCWQLEASDPCVEILSAKQPGRTKRGAPKGSGDEAVFVMAPQLVLSVTCLPNCPEGSALFAVLKSSPSHTTVSPGGWLRLTCYFMPHRVALRIYWQALVLIAKGVRYCPHPNEYDGASYETLVGRPGPRAVEDGALPNRAFVFREFNSSGEHKTRISMCPLFAPRLALPSGVCPISRRADTAGDGSGTEPAGGGRRSTRSSASASAVGGSGGRNGRQTGARARSPGNRRAATGVDNRVGGGGEEGSVAGGPAASKLRYYDGVHWVTGH